MNDNCKEVYINGQIYILEWDARVEMWRSELLGEWDAEYSPRLPAGEQFMEFWLPDEAVQELEVAA